MMETDEEHTFPQGSQPQLRGVRVGVQRVGEPGGVATARLLLRDGRTRRRVDLTAATPVDLLGRGTLELLAVHRPTGQMPTASVTVRVRA